MGVIWTIIIGLIAGIVAKLIIPGSKNEPAGFVLTAILGYSARSSLLISVKRWAGINPAKVPASSVL